MQKGIKTVKCLKTDWQNTCADLENLTFITLSFCSTLTIVLLPGTSVVK